MVSIVQCWIASNNGIREVLLYVAILAIGNSQTVIDLWTAHPRCSAMMVGFSCQPHATGGQQNGANDSRSTTLVAALKAAFRMRCHIIILECVPYMPYLFFFVFLFLFFFQFESVFGLFFVAFLTVLLTWGDMKGEFQLTRLIVMSE